MCSYFFFFNDTATTEIYTLSLHDALPISDRGHAWQNECQQYALPQPLPHFCCRIHCCLLVEIGRGTRLNSSHGYISYAVFCLKKKKITIRTQHIVQNYLHITEPLTITSAI